MQTQEIIWDWCGIVRLSLEMDRYDLADPSTSPRQCTDCSTLLDREGAGWIIRLGKAWKNLISGACCHHSGLQWTIGVHIETSIEEKSESLKKTKPQWPIGGPTLCVGLTREGGDFVTKAGGRGGDDGETSCQLLGSPPAAPRCEARDVCSLLPGGRRREVDEGELLLL